VPASDGPIGRMVHTVVRSIAFPFLGQSSWIVVYGNQPARKYPPTYAFVVQQPGRLVPYQAVSGGEVGAFMLWL